MMKKVQNKKVIIWFVVIVVFIFFSLGIFLFYKFYVHNVKGTQSAIVVKETDKNFDYAIDGNKAYEMGLNNADTPVFKDRKKAFTQLMSDCKNGIEELKSRNGFWKFSEFTWRDYYAAANGGDGDYEYLDEVNKIAAVLDIYENSFI